jgi:hypothetical protein
MRNKLIVAIIFLLFAGSAKPEEGMWIPLFLGELNEAQMKAMGMRISADDIYSQNHSSLKDAIVIFGGGCTAEVISGQGLILTNHHCGYGTIQSHSSLEHDYLTNGFWAMNHSDELPCPGLKVTFLVRMEEVTDSILAGVDPQMSEAERKSVIDKNSERIKEIAIKDSHYDAVIKSFFYGNRYFLFINEVFEDIRLVGAPPSSIGKFGGDTDNWMYPRHTGDFSLFRIYADSANQPAGYSESNVPYSPKKHFSLSTKGIREGDFTFVFGYPGNTSEYIPSFGVDMQVNTLNPIRIDLQGKRIEIYKQAMAENAEVRIQYSAKLAGIANGWKKSVGESRGIMRLKTIEKKQEFERELMDWAGSSEERSEKYNSLIPEFKKIYGEINPVHADLIYLREIVFAVELFRFARSFDELVSLCKSGGSDNESIQKAVEALTRSSETFYKNYQPATDEKVFISLFPGLFSERHEQMIPPFLVKAYKRNGNSAERLCEEIFRKSVFTSGAEVFKLLAHYKRTDYKKIERDPAFSIASQTSAVAAEKYLPLITDRNKILDSLMRLYMKAQMEMQPYKNFYPDANFTLRVTYGNVMGYEPSDAVRFDYFTTLKGIIEKEDPDIYDYQVTGKLKELFRNKDFGKYADRDGTMHVCFIATNHTSGGNSGSPVLDADGNLIGLNFDRCWEGTMSDLDYDASLCRNIGLDIRYCLFIIDKFAGATHLVDEMTIISE